MLDQEKELQNDSGRPLSYNNFTDIKKNGCCKEAVLFAFCVLNWVSPTVIQSPGLVGYVLKDSLCIFPGD